MKNALSPAQAAYLIINKTERVNPLGLDGEHPITIARATAFYKKSVIDKTAFGLTTGLTALVAFLVAIGGFVYKLDVGHGLKPSLVYVGMVTVLWTIFTFLRYGLAKNRITRIPEADRVMLGALQEVLVRARDFDTKLAEIYKKLSGESGVPTVLSASAVYKLNVLRDEILDQFMRERQLFVQFDQRLLRKAAERKERSLKNTAKA